MPLTVCTSWVITMVYVCGIFPALLGNLTVLFPEPQNSHHRNECLMPVSTQLLCLKFDVNQNLFFYSLLGLQDLEKCLALCNSLASNTIIEKPSSQIESGIQTFVQCTQSLLLLKMLIKLANIVYYQEYDSWLHVLVRSQLLEISLNCF